MFANDVPFKDFQERIVNCQTEAKERGLAGLMVWSRGGGTFDRYADVDYLANFYQQRCYLQDYLPLWSGRSHCVLLIPVNGQPILIVSSPEYRQDLIAIEDIRYSADFMGLCCDALSELGLANENLALIGGDVLTYALSKQLFDRLPNIILTPSDDLLSNIRKVKTSREIECIEEACRIGSKAMNILMENVSVNKTESEVIAPAIEYIISKGAVLYFVVTSSGQYSDFAHTIDFPGYDSVRKLKEGEIFRVDLIIAYQGYLCDFGRTTIVGNNSSNEQREMLDIVTGACEHIISSIKTGVSVNELCKLGDEYLLEHGVSLSPSQDDDEKIYATYPPHWGHSLGMTWEKPYLIPEEEEIIQPGMYLAIEKSLYKPGVGTVFFEQNILVTDNGPKLLTDTKKCWY